MKKIIALTTLALSLSSFAAIEIPGSASQIAIASVGMTKVATAFRARACTESDPQVEDCKDAIAFKKMVEVTVRYIDSDLSTEDQDQYVSELYEVSEFSSSELSSLEAQFKLSVTNSSRLSEQDICVDEYGCVNRDGASVHSSEVFSTKIVKIIRK